MILSYIRKNQCKRLFYPLMLLGVVIFLVWRSPVTEYVTKRTISNAVLINDSMAKKVLYAKIKTGEDCLAGGELVGHYYYELIGGSCHFYLIRAVAGYPASKTLEGQTIIGRVDAFEPEILDPLTQKLAEDISWDAKSLKSVCQKYFVNQTAYGCPPFGVCLNDCGFYSHIFIYHKSTSNKNLPKSGALWQS